MVSAASHILLLTAINPLKPVLFALQDWFGLQVWTHVRVVTCSLNIYIWIKAYGAESFINS